jgi:hypothetical protein
VHPALRTLLDDQAGVVSRRQATACGLAPHDLARAIRRRELVRLHPGVYLAHTGEPTWLQRAWAGVLLCWPAALSHTSALRAVEGPGGHRQERVIEVAVDNPRTPIARPGLVVHRLRDLEQRVQWNAGPPRLRYEEAALDVAALARSDFAALAELSRAVQGRRTTAARLLSSLESRGRISRRRWLEAVLRDIAEGACSVLERGYLTNVERAHGLSAARRQVRDRVGAGAVYRDVEYADGLVVELDGRLFHDTAAQRDRDFDRDLVAAVQGKDTVRLTYGQVFDRPCWTAGHVAILLTAHGWQGSVRRCGPTCPAPDIAGALQRAI